MRTIANGPVMDVFAQFDLQKIALLLDVDGTIVDIGPSPAEVHVGAGLLETLKRLFALMDGALALVSGRPIGDLDRLFAPLRLPTIGGHGAEMRLRDNEVFFWAKPLPHDLRKRLAESTGIGSGVVVEDKDYSLALHYRKSPGLADSLRRHVAASQEAFPGEPTELLQGKAMFEVKRPGVNKGESVRRLMEHSPFAGRMPVFIGDDVTDESVFKVLPEIGGKGFSVNRHFPGLTGIFRNPAHVRDVLRALADIG
ncbi:MAG: trehalose-phosphatase [Pseudolabrys sp.]